MFRRKIEQTRRVLKPATVTRLKPIYYGNDKPHNEDSVKARHATEQRRTFWKRLRLVPTLIALLAILISVVYSTTLSTVPGINFAGVPSVYRTTAEYKKGFTTILDSSVMNNSKLTINTIAIQAKILKDYPELDGVSIGLPVVGRRPTITIHARAPALVLTTKNNAFVLDDYGKIVAEVKQLPSSITSQLLTAQDQSNLMLHVGDQALTTDTMTFIKNIQAQLAAKQLNINNLTLPNGGNELDVHIVGLPYYLKTDTSGDARIQIGGFLAVKDSGTSPVEYMDVRVEEKVFYK